MDRQKKAYNAHQLLVTWLVPALIFYDNGNFCEEYNLLWRDGIQPSRRGRAIFTRRLAYSVRSALN